MGLVGNKAVFTTGDKEILGYVYDKVRIKDTDHYMILDEEEYEFHIVPPKRVRFRPGVFQLRRQRREEKERERKIKEREEKERNENQEVLLEEKETLNNGPLQVYYIKSKDGWFGIHLTGDGEKDSVIGIHKTKGLSPTIDNEEKEPVVFQNVIAVSKETVMQITYEAFIDDYLNNDEYGILRRVFEMDYDYIRKIRKNYLCTIE